MTTCNLFPYGRFNNSSSNFKIFPKTFKESCSEKVDPIFVLDNNGKWQIDGQNYILTGRSSEVFREKVVEELCPGTTNTFVKITKWVPLVKPIYKDIGAVEKRGNIFANSAYKMTKAERLTFYSNNRINR
jgi:hypothetical protein